jgi:uncharacterized protein
VKDWRRDMTLEITVRDNSESRSYDAITAGQIVGSIVYERTGPRIVFSHTVVEPAFRGQGIATQLVREALDDVRANGLTLTNYCGFVGDFLSAHPEYADLVDSTHPGRIHHNGT